MRFVGLLISTIVIPNSVSAAQIFKNTNQCSYLGAQFTMPIGGTVQSASYYLPYGTGPIALKQGDVVQLSTQIQVTAPADTAWSSLPLGLGRAIIRTTTPMGCGMFWSDTLRYPAIVPYAMEDYSADHEHHKVINISASDSTPADGTYYYYVVVYHVHTSPPAGAWAQLDWGNGFLQVTKL